MVNIIVHLKSQLGKLFKDFNEVHQWKINRKIQSQGHSQESIDLAIRHVIEECPIVDDHTVKLHCVFLNPQLIKDELIQQLCRRSF